MLVSMLQLIRTWSVCNEGKPRSMQDTIKRDVLGESLGEKEAISNADWTMMEGLQR